MVAVVMMLAAVEISSVCWDVVMVVVIVVTVGVTEVVG